ncbi:uroporphyrin-III C-methyltransferase/precorrin-2 dehydrogenase/sirohydrochlorin ferrochelatase [Stella humosa]|uniref:Uroporphyrin-III C-methyltransferase/precorrin-2 dehydrogenase/sirohydrochlorin ferrochelatase n=1 Tax=Stella humosa TaxID=94 RepID=A0A3N1KPM4_9PROT|nr:siroheme synthase CysG [Stella humosa]ROP81297.1 uroporphyrin-III C-methyltransferase/precorrin-2 dehydrogenase/sirohydrochlorin ferrochelatase [Stella humosa]
MRHFPIFLDLHARTALIVGDGERAEAKASALSAAGATIVRHAGDTVPDAEAVRAATVVFICVFDEAVARATAALAMAERVPVNVVDRPDISTFVMPAIVDRGDVVVAVGTGGAAPVLARRIRARIQQVLPERLGQLASFANRFRSTVKAAIPDFDSRRRLWERVLAGPIADQVLAGREPEAHAAMVEAINRREAVPAGIVHLVGAGPGDPELLTLRALRLIEEAEVIVHDDLVSAEILSRARVDATRIAVGKRQGRPSTPQAEIEALLVQHAAAGRRVVRLKGGDPFVFGRGGEEVEALRAAGIAFTVVPGITAALGCAAALDLPLTHRDHASALTLVTGQGRFGVGPPVPTDANHTVALYMGSRAAADVAQDLIDGGRDPATPVAVVENGTRLDQRVAFGTLAGLGRLVADERGDGPALILIGETVALARGAPPRHAAVPARRRAAGAA